MTDHRPTAAVHGIRVRGGARAGDADPWLVHDAPGRPLVYGACFCGCATCRAELDRAVAARPGLVLGVKFGAAERLVLDAGVLAGGRDAEDDLLRRFGGDDDRIRELWVAGEREDGMSPGEALVLEAVAARGLPTPEWHVEVDADGARRPAPVRRVRRSDGR